MTDRTTRPLVIIASFAGSLVVGLLVMLSLLGGFRGVAAPAAFVHRTARITHARQHEARADPWHDVFVASQPRDRPDRSRVPAGPRL